MKTIIQKSIGGDGATITVGTDDSGNLFFGATYPLSKIEGPADKGIDDVAAKLEGLLGNSGWVKAIIDPLDAAAKAEIHALLVNP